MTKIHLLKDVSVDLHTLPEVTLIDLVNYLILTHSFYTGQQMKAYKGLNAYKYYESGLVQEVKAKKMNDKSFVVVGKVSISLCICIIEIKKGAAQNRLHLIFYLLL